MKKIFRVLGMIFAAYAIVMAAMIVQYFFDRGDLKKAAAVVYQFKPVNGKESTLIDFMADEQHLAPDAINCQTQIASRYEGRVAVTCDGYQWMVDVVGSRIYPQNEQARKLMTLLVP